MEDQPSFWHNIECLQACRGCIDDQKPEWLVRKYSKRMLTLHLELLIKGQAKLQILLHLSIEAKVQHPTKEARGTVIRMKKSVQFSRGNQRTREISFTSTESK